MKIVVLDGYTENPGDLSWDGLAALGELTVYDRTPLKDTAEIIRRIGDAEVVFTNKTPLTREILDACPSVKFISVLATGYNIVDTAAAKEKGIPVTNVPAYGTASVGQFAIALLLEICHHIAHHDKAVHEGRWASCPDFCFWDYPLIELAGKTIGIIGFGRIGQTTGKIASALGMRVLAYDTYQSESGKAIGTYTDLDTLLAECCWRVFGEGLPVLREKNGKPWVRGAAFPSRPVFVPGFSGGGIPLSAGKDPPAVFILYGEKSAAVKSKGAEPRSLPPAFL